MSYVRVRIFAEKFEVKINGRKLQEINKMFSDSHFIRNFELEVFPITSNMKFSLKLIYDFHV